MKAHETGNNARLRTVELELNDTTYNVALDLYTISKIADIPENTPELVTVGKTVKYLCNGAIKRKNKEELTKSPLLDDDDVLLYISPDNLPYFTDKIKEIKRESTPDEEKETDEDGNETVVTDEMIEEFGEAPEIKNVTTE